MSKRDTRKRLSPEQPEQQPQLRRCYIWDGMTPDDRTLTRLAVFESGITGQGVIGRMHFGPLCHVCRLVGSGHLSDEEGKRVLLILIAALDMLDTLDAETDVEAVAVDIDIGPATQAVHDKTAPRRRGHKPLPGCPFGPQGGRNEPA